MKRCLKEVAKIQSGIYTQTAQDGNAVYLQAKHFTESGKLAGKLHNDLQLTSQNEKHLLQDGDVLLAAKGTKNFAACYKAENGACVASSTFLVIRVQDKLKPLILPDYLTWYLNHPETQTWLKAQAIGSNLPSISKAVLQELELPVPPVKQQLAILKIDALRKQEASLAKQLEALKEKYIQQQLLNAISA